MQDHLVTLEDGRVLDKETGKIYEVVFIDKKFRGRLSFGGKEAAHTSQAMP